MKKFLILLFILYLFLSGHSSHQTAQAFPNWKTTAAIRIRSFSAANDPHLPIVMQRWFQGVWHGQIVRLTNVPNVTVEQLPDAQLVGQIHNFLAHELPTSKPPFYCLNGENINVWIAPHEFPGVYVVHNGDQGNQCTYGTWTFSPPPPPPPPPPPSGSPNSQAYGRAQQ